jgi:hypothetical protein
MSIWFWLKNRCDCPGWVVEAHRTGGLAGKRRRRAVIRVLLVGGGLTGMGDHGVALAGSSSSKAALHEGEVEVVLLPAFDDDVGAERWLAIVNGDGGSREQSAAGAGKHERGGGDEMGKDFSTEPMHEGIRVSWHRVVATTGACALSAITAVTAWWPVLWQAAWVRVTGACG